MQKPNSFTIDEALHMLTESAAAENNNERVPCTGRCCRRGERSLRRLPVERKP